MPAFLQNIHPIFFLIVATALEVSGDAVIRMAIYDHAGLYRIALFLGGAVLGSHRVRRQSAAGEPGSLGAKETVPKKQGSAGRWTASFSTSRSSWITGSFMS